jgi:hypothetical protein
MPLRKPHDAFDVERKIHVFIRRNRLLLAVRNDWGSDSNDRSGYESSV